MADLTALDMAKEEVALLKDYARDISGALNFTFEGGHVDTSKAAQSIRVARACLDRLADAVFTVNREQKNSDEAIQKQQILYKKEQERLAREATEKAEIEALRPFDFRLD